MLVLKNRENMRKAKSLKFERWGVNSPLHFFSVHGKMNRFKNQLSHWTAYWLIDVGFETDLPSLA